LLKFNRTVNTYSTSDGERLKKSVIDARVRKAKASKLMQQVNKHGYNFCEDCNVNSFNNRLDVSHDVSVDECQKSGRAELAYSIDNLTVRCRTCHRIHDKTY
jgi:hypothetical protein